jgi:GDP-L-fucose synthase
MKAYIAGHQGLVGSALVRRYARESAVVITSRARTELNLEDGHAVDAFFAQERPDQVLLAAARVGGIGANQAYPADFLFANLKIQTNVLSSVVKFDVQKCIFLGSSCIYPRDASQPITESKLLTGPLEKSNEAYAVAKIAGIKLAQSIRRQYGVCCIAAMPCNLYGENDNFDLQSAHVLPAMIRRVYEAKIQSAPFVTFWGSGQALREFLHADDAAEAIAFLMNEYDGEEPVNVGSGSEISIRQLAETIRDIVGYRGDIRWDRSKPDGTPRKLLDSTRIVELGWHPRIRLEEGIETTYRWFAGRRELGLPIRGVA